jgi:hypothetical protein
VNGIAADRSRWVKPSSAKLKKSAVGYRGGEDRLQEGGMVGVLGR